MMEIMVLLLIRHAITDWVGERLAGWTPGIHLSEEGRAQAAALARLLAEAPLAAIYSSPLERTLETARPLADAHGLTVKVREGLGEARCGDWTGRTLKELQKDDLWPIVQTYPSGFRFPGGESMREIQARMVAELDAIRDAHGGQIVAAVSHADPIRTAAAYYAGLPLDLFQRLAISPASVTAFAFSRFGPHLACLNYTASLPSFSMDRKGEDKEKEP
jgi:probable phosphomutase (TIGR03848 family)